MRIVTTNDFVASFFPQATSYGRLPGAAALRATVDDLRTQAGGGFWIDTGDLAQGSALGALSDGVWPFLALRELSIDVAAAGNHELDWGARTCGAGAPSCRSRCWPRTCGWASRPRGCCRRRGGRSA